MWISGSMGDPVIWPDPLRGLQLEPIPPQNSHIVPNSSLTLAVVLPVNKLSSRCLG